MEKELEQYGDIVFVQEKTNYKSILYKTYYVRRGAGGPPAVACRCAHGERGRLTAAPAHPPRPPRR